MFQLIVSVIEGDEGQNVTSLHPVHPILVEMVEGEHVHHEW